jgi:UDP-GlcNAc3NAcA epimerase
MRILTVVGARPQFIKAAVVSRQIQRLEGLEEVLVHTGQHYDESMSQIFFDDLGLPAPTYHLKNGGGLHGAQTARMLESLEAILRDDRPDAVLVYGDTNSTLAGALAASKLHIPVIHVEAGLRSFNRRMPEEVNRVLTDHLSNLLLCPTEQAVAWLAAEGIREGAQRVGDVMYDSVQLFREVARGHVDPLARLGLEAGGYVLMTCHRAENTDDPERFSEIIAGGLRTARELPVVFPVHPRIRSRVAQLEIPAGCRFHTVPPVSYLEMLRLQEQAAAVFTDSGGMQKEAFILGVPCVTGRDQTEWVETVSSGANQLVAADAAAIQSALQRAIARDAPIPAAGPHYGEGQASAKVAQATLQFLQQRVPPARVAA